MNDNDSIPKFPLTLTFEYTILPPLVVEHAIRLKILLLLYANYSTIEALFLSHWLIYRLIQFKISEPVIDDHKQQFLDDNQFTNDEVLQHLLPIHTDDFELLFSDEIEPKIQRQLVCTTLVCCMIAEKLMGSDTIVYGDWNFYKVISGFGMYDFIKWERVILKFIDYRVPIATDLLLLYENRNNHSITTHELLTSLFDRNRYTDEFLLSDDKFRDLHFLFYRSYVLNVRLVNQHRVFYYRYETVTKKLNFTRINNIPQELGPDGVAEYDIVVIK